jgi:hypothetical protein
LGFDTISPSALTDSTPSYVVYSDDTPPFPHHVSNGLHPPINVDIGLATSMNSRGPASSSSASLTPGLISPSHPNYSSSPSVLAVTPPTPVQNLGGYSPFLSSTPVSPYVTQHSPWHTSNPVCLFYHPFCVHLSNQPTHSNRHRSQSVHSARASGDLWCHRSVTSPILPATDVATLMKSTWSHPSISICRGPTKKGYP